MPKIVRSALFRRQLLDITAGYRECAGATNDLKLIYQICDSIATIAANPPTCAVYTRLQGKEVRKWRVKDFPVSLFFRLEGQGTIVLEALYAHRMNIAG